MNVLQQHSVSLALAVPSIRGSINVACPRSFRASVETRRRTRALVRPAAAGMAAAPEPRLPEETGGGGGAARLREHGQYGEICS